MLTPCPGRRKIAQVQSELEALEATRRASDEKVRRVARPGSSVRARFDSPCRSVVPLRRPLAVLKVCPSPSSRSHPRPYHCSCPSQLELRRRQFALLMHAAHDLQQTLEDADADHDAGRSVTPVASGMDTAADAPAEAPPSA